MNLCAVTILNLRLHFFPVEICTGQGWVEWIGTLATVTCQWIEDLGILLVEWVSDTSVIGFRASSGVAFCPPVVVCLLADWFCVWRCYVIVLWFNLIRTNSLYLFRWWLWRRHGQWWHGAHGDWIRYIKYSVHYFSKAVKHQFIPEVHVTFGGTALADSWGLFYYWWLLNVCILNCFLRAIIQPIMQKSEFVDHGAESHCVSCLGE